MSQDITGFCSRVYYLSIIQAHQQSSSNFLYHLDVVHRFEDKYLTARSKLFSHHRVYHQYRNIPREGPRWDAIVSLLSTQLAYKFKFRWDEYKYNSGMRSKLGMRNCTDGKQSHLKSGNQLVGPSAQQHKPPFYGRITNRDASERVVNLIKGRSNCSPNIDK